MFQLLHLWNQAGLFVLQDVFLLDALVAAGLCVTSVFQGPALLLQTHHFVFAEASEEPIELPDWHGNELVVWEGKVGVAPPVVAAVPLKMLVRTEDLLILRRLRGRAPHFIFQIGVLTVTAWDALHVGVTRKFRVVVDRLVEVAVSFVFSLVRWWMVAVGHRRGSLLRCGADQGLNCVLGCEPKSLRVHLVGVNPAVRYPERVALRVISLLVWMEVWWWGYRVARCAARGGGDGVWSLELAARPNEGAVYRLHRLLLYAELHQVEVVDEIHWGFLQSQMWVRLGHIRLNGKLVSTKSSRCPQLFHAVSKIAPTSEKNCNPKLWFPFSRGKTCALKAPTFSNSVRTSDSAPRCPFGLRIRKIKVNWCQRTRRTSACSGEAHFLHKAALAWCHAFRTTPPHSSPIKTKRFA